MIDIRQVPVNPVVKDKLISLSFHFLYFFHNYSHLVGIILLKYLTLIVNVLSINIFMYTVAIDPFCYYNLLKFIYNLKIVMKSKLMPTL